MHHVYQRQGVREMRRYRPPNRLEVRADLF